MSKLFLIEDNQTDSKLIQKAIENNFRSIQVFTYESVERALSDVHEKPDYILLDHFLDKTNGIESIPVFKEFAPEAKVIVVSSQNDIEVFENAYLNGASEYFRKDGLLINNIIAYIKKDIENSSKNWFNSVKSIFKNEGPPTKAKTIYVLDDNISTSYFTQHILQFESFNTVLLFSCTEAFLTQVRKRNPDAVILEYFKGEKKKEIGLVREIKIISPKTTILIFSDQKDVRIASELIQSGASHYLIKSHKNLVRLKTILN